LNIDKQDRAEAQQILEAVRQIQGSPELQAEAAKEPETVLNRLRLSGVARHAVALAITAAAIAPAASKQTIVTPQSFWI
jgi:hypothetical protein